MRSVDYTVRSSAEFFLLFPFVPMMMFDSGFDLVFEYMLLL